MGKKLIRGNTVSTPLKPGNGGGGSGGNPLDTNVKLTAAYTFTKDFGNYTVPSGETFAEYGEKGQTLRSFLEGAFCERIIPELDDLPTISISVLGGEGEVGSSFDPPTATLTIDDVGRYPYGSVDTEGNKYDSANTGITFAAYNVSLQQVDANGNVIKLDSKGNIIEVDADGNYKTEGGRLRQVTNADTMVTSSTLSLSAVGNDTEYGTSPIWFYFKAPEANYTAPTNRRALDNIGSEAYTIVDGEKAYLRFASGKHDKVTKSVSFTGYRKCFWGYKSTDDALANPAAITSAQVRALQESGRYLPYTSYTVPADTKQVFFLAPSGTQNGLSITNKNALNAPVGCTKLAGGVDDNKQPFGIWVQGANGFTAAAYDMWYVNLDSPFSSEAKLVLTWT